MWVIYVSVAKQDIVAIGATMAIGATVAIGATECWWKREWNRVGWSLQTRDCTVWLFESFAVIPNVVP